MAVVGSVIWLLGGKKPFGWVELNFKHFQKVAFETQGNQKISNYGETPIMPKHLSELTRSFSVKHNRMDLFASDSEVISLGTGTNLSETSPM